jgi:hypothetical protein
MGIIKTLKASLELEREWLPKIHAELAKMNERQAQQSHETLGVYRDVHKALKDLAPKMDNFIQVITNFFGIERALHEAAEKRRLMIEDEFKPGRHDNLF